MICQRRASTLSRLLAVARQRLLTPTPGFPPAFPPAFQRAMAMPYAAAMATPPPFPGARGPANGPSQDHRWNNPSSTGPQMGGQDPFRSPNSHRLYRNPAQGKIAGVCAGIADYFSIDVAVVRIATVVGAFIGFPIAVTAYLVLALVLKPAPRGLYHNGEEEAFWRSVNTRPDQTLAALHARLRGLDQQIVAMEGFIASREFDLRRQFKDLEK